MLEMQTEIHTLTKPKSPCYNSPNKICENWPSSYVVLETETNNFLGLIISASVSSEVCKVTAG